MPSELYLDHQGECEAVQPGSTGGFGAVFGLVWSWVGFGLVYDWFWVSFGLVLGFWVHLGGFEWIGFGWVGLFRGFGFENTPIPGAVFGFDLVGFGIILGRYWVYLG